MSGIIERNSYILWIILNYLISELLWVIYVYYLAEMYEENLVYMSIIILIIPTFEGWYRGIVKTLR